MKIFKPKFWDDENLSFVSIIFLPISSLIQCLLLLKKKLSKMEQYKIPIICVGNLYIGGTGKTPLTIKIFSMLKILHKKPVIIKKFYKNQFDEIRLINDKTKNFINADSRIAGVNLAIKKRFKSIILDDGLQDFTIKKDLNLICFNSNQLVGNGLTIPSGPLRQKLNTIRKNDILIINGDRKIKFEKKIKIISKKIKIFYTEYKPIDIKKFKKKRYLVFAGIGNPINFYKILKKNRINVVKRISFPDHYEYSKYEIKEIIKKAKKDNLDIMTTEKDYFRIKHFRFNNINIFKVKLFIKKENEFKNILESFL